VPVGLRSPVAAAWWQAHPAKTRGRIFSVDELTTSVAGEAGGVKDYGLLVASTPNNVVLFQLYSDVPSTQTFERFIYREQNAVEDRTFELNFSILKRKRLRLPFTEFALRHLSSAYGVSMPPPITCVDHPSACCDFNSVTAIQARRQAETRLTIALANDSLSRLTETLNTSPHSFAEDRTDKMYAGRGELIQH